jgi:hypothetical protein
MNPTGIEPAPRVHRRIISEQTACADWSKRSRAAPHLLGCRVELPSFEARAVEAAGQAEGAHRATSAGSCPKARGTCHTTRCTSQEHESPQHADQPLRIVSMVLSSGPRSQRPRKPATQVPWVDHFPSGEWITAERLAIGESWPLRQTSRLIGESSRFSFRRSGGGADDGEAVEGGDCGEGTQ